MPEIFIDNVTFAYDDKPIVDGVTLTVPSGDFFSLVGPNGAGKTTLLKLLTRLHPPDAGTIRIDGQSLERYTLPALAKLMAVVPQKESIIFPFTVREVVLMGRSPHLRGLGFENRRDRDIAHRAMRMADIAHLSDKAVTELSGGEQHRVAIARALAQQTPVLLLDEPNAHLDLQHQVELFDLLRRLNRTEGTTIVCVSHDINLAARYSLHMGLLDKGKLSAFGPPRDVVTADRISRVFRVPVTVTLTGAERGTPHILLPDGIPFPDEPRLTTAPVAEWARPSEAGTLPMHARAVRTLLKTAVASEAVTAVFLAMVRYASQGMNLTQFSPFHPANLFSALLTLIMIGGIVLQLRHSARANIRSAKLTLILSLSGIGLLLWCAVPEEATRTVAAGAFLLLKSYQAGFIHVNYFARGRHALRTAARSLTAAIVCLTAMACFALVYSWFGADFQSLPAQELSQTVAVVHPTGWSGALTEPELQTIHRLRTESGLEHFLLRIPGEAAHAEGTEEYARQLVQIGIADSRLTMRKDSFAKGVWFSVVRALSRESGWKEWILVADRRAISRIGTMYTFHGFPVRTAPVQNNDTMAGTIGMKLRESARLLSFWIFGFEMLT